jgi:hypothetical protein
MVGSYPEIFRAGSASAGVPFGCFTGANSWSDACAKGQITKTPQEWGNLVRAAYPGYTGPRPKIQLWHGTKDDILAPVNFDEEIDQWTNVLGVSQTPATTENNQPLAGYVRMRYTNGSGAVMVESIKATDQGHNCTISEDSVISFFGLNKTVPVLDGAADGRPGDHRPSIMVEKSSTGIVRFSVSSRPGRITLDLCNLRGAKIRTIADQKSPAGTLKISWDAGGRGGARLPAGMYMISATVNGMPVGTYRTALIIGQ